MSYDKLISQVEKLTKDNPEQAEKGYEFLIQAARLIMDPAMQQVVVEGIEVRRKWHRIKTDYQELRASMRGSKAVEELSAKYNYSEKTIQRIIYEL